MRPPSQLIDKIMGTTAKQNYYSALMELDKSGIAAIELAMVRTGIGGGFNPTCELMNLSKQFKGKMQINGKRK